MTKMQRSSIFIFKMFEKGLSKNIRHVVTKKNRHVVIKKTRRRVATKKTRRLPKNVLKYNEGKRIATREFTDNKFINKYAEYFEEKSRKIDTGRLQKSDGVRKKVYESEWTVKQMYPFYSRNLSVEDCHEFFNEVVQSDTYKSLVSKNKGELNPTLRFMNPIKNSRVAGSARLGVISLRRGLGCNKYTILHELAHTSGNRHHDLSFRVTLIELVKKFFGKNMSRDLKKTFMRNGLKMSMNTKIKTPSEWFKSYKNMSVIRSKKN